MVEPPTNEVAQVDHTIKEDTEDQSKSGGGDSPTQLGNPPQIQSEIVGATSPPEIEKSDETVKLLIF